MVNVLGWVAVAVAVVAATAGARWGLAGVIYGVGIGWAVRAGSAFYLTSRHLRLPVATGGGGVMSAEWAVALFQKSVLKQAKYRDDHRVHGRSGGQPLLDIGADNGVISLLLRRRGGRWDSADLDEHTVASIRQLVGDDVHQLDGSHTPFPDRAFDQIVVVDYLEHIPDDGRFADELARILNQVDT